MPAVSVIMPAYNVEPYIGERPSTPRSRRPFARLRAARRRRRLDRRARRQSLKTLAARRFARSACSSKTNRRHRRRRAISRCAPRAASSIALLDSDDIWDPEFLETQLAILDGAARGRHRHRQRARTSAGRSDGEPARPFPIRGRIPICCDIIARRNGGVHHVACSAGGCTTRSAASTSRCAPTRTTTSGCAPRQPASASRATIARSATTAAAATACRRATARMLARHPAWSTRKLRPRFAGSARRDGGPSSGRSARFERSCWRGSASRARAARLRVGHADTSARSRARRRRRARPSRASWPAGPPALLGGLYQTRRAHLAQRGPAAGWRHEVLRSSSPRITAPRDLRDTLAASPRLRPDGAVGSHRRRQQLDRRHARRRRARGRDASRAAPLRVRARAGPQPGAERRHPARARARSSSRPMTTCGSSATGSIARRDGLDAPGCDYVGGRVLPIWGGPRPGLAAQPRRQALGGDRAARLTGRSRSSSARACRSASTWRSGAAPSSAPACSIPHTGRKAGTLLGQEVREWCIRARRGRPARLLRAGDGGAAHHPGRRA